LEESVRFIGQKKEVRERAYLRRCDEQVTMQFST